jgi:hypothetical protein
MILTSNALVGKERREKRGGLFLEDPAADEGMGFGLRLIENEIIGGHGPLFFVEGGVDDPEEAGLHDGPRAHQTWFEGDVKGTALEGPSAQFLLGFLDGLNLGVAGDGLVFLSMVMAFRDQFVIFDDDGSDRDFAFMKSFLGLKEGRLHPFLIVDIHGLMINHRTRAIGLRLLGSPPDLVRGSPFAMA